MVAPFGRTRRGRAGSAVVAALLAVLAAPLLSPSAASAEGIGSAAAHGAVNGPPVVPTSTSFPQGFPDLLGDAEVPSFPQGAPAASIARWVDAALGVRADRLVALATEVAAAPNLSVPAQTTLQSLLAADAAGVATLEAEASVAPDLATLEGVASSMVLSYRVLSVVSPLVTDSIELSNQQQRASSLQSGEAALEAAITTGLQSGSAAGTAQALYRDLVSQIAPVAGNDASALSSLLAMKPASFDASETTIGDAEAVAADGWNRVRAAATDERKVVALLAASGVSSNLRVEKMLRTLTR